jgi:hypothetical protein
MIKWIIKWWWSKKQRHRITATTYYISGNGHDQNDGKHPLRAWKSIYHLNQQKMKIRAQDQILYRRGYTYPGCPFYLNSNRYHIRTGAYGSGSYPVFPDIKTDSIPAKK